MRTRPQRSTRTDTLFPYTTRFRSKGAGFSRLLRQAASLRGRWEISPAMQPRLPGAFAPQRLPGACAPQRLPGACAPLRLRRSGCMERSEEHTSELQSLMRISYAVFCLKKKKKKVQQTSTDTY